MARPNSRYFAPVIKKFSEAKRAENIVINEAFKASLRTRLLNHIHEVPAIQTEATFSWQDFFQRWKYPFAAIPSLLLLTIVAVQAFRWTVDLKSGTEMPKVDTTMVVESQEDEKSELKDEVQTEEPKLKTFPGRLVLPSQDKLEPLVGGSLQQANVKSEVKKDQPKVPEVPAIAPLNNDAVYNNVLTQEVAPTLDAVPLADSATKPLPEPEASPVPAGSLDAAPKLVEAPLNETSTQELRVVMPLETAPLLNNDYPVNYSFTFSSAEKVILENTVVPALVKGRTAKIEGVMVYKNKDEGIKVQVTFVGGEQKSFLLKKNILTGGWELIK